MNPKKYEWEVDWDLLKDLEFPKQWPKIELKTPESVLKEKNDDLRKENEALTKAFADAEREIDRLRAENERLKQELAEARELSLF